MNTIIKSILKRILRILLIGSITFFIAYSTLIASGYILHNIFNINIGETTNVFTYSFPEFISIIFILILPVSILYGLVFTIILFPFSLLDKRFLNRWFIVGSALYSYVSANIICDLLYTISFILISLAIALVIMNIKKVNGVNGVK